MGAPFNPKTNGLVERMVRSAKESMEKMENQPGSFYVKLQRFLLSYYNTPHAKTGRSLAVLMFVGHCVSTSCYQSHEELRKKTVTTKFRVGQPILARDYLPRNQNGKIEKRIGTYLYHV